MTAFRKSENPNTETVLRYIHDKHITIDNYELHENTLRSFFADEESYILFVEDYLRQVGFLSNKNFFQGNQKIDAFPHPRNFHQPPHTQDFFEMKYLVQGSGTVYAGNRAYFLKESDICLVAPNTLHSCGIFPEQASMINLVIPPSSLQTVFPRLLQFPNEIRSFFQASAENPILYFHTDFDSEIRKLVQDIYDYYRNNKTFSLIGNLSSEANLERIFLIILQKYGTESPGNHASSAKRIEKMMEYIQENLSDVTFSDVASHFHFSESYTSRYIKKQTGQTFSTVVRILRIKEAARLLSTTDFSVDQIAQQVGYAGRTSFYENFKELFGMTPAEFRKTSG